MYQPNATVSESLADIIDRRAPRLTVYPPTPPTDQEHDDWFATIAQGSSVGVWNAPGATRAQAVRAAWDAYTSWWVDTVAMLSGGTTQEALR